MEDRPNRWSELKDTLRKSVDKSYEAAQFVCENARFLCTGKASESRRLFEDDVLNNVAAGLGHQAIYGTVARGDSTTTECFSVEDYHFEDFFDVLEAACQKVDPPLAFVAVLESLRHLPVDAGRLLVLLEKVISKCADRAQRVTTALATLSEVFDRSEHVTPYVRFFRAMWSLDIQDAHNVSKASLRSLVLRMHTSTVNGIARFREAEAGEYLANLLCCWQNDMLSWISSICVYSGQPSPCTLDSTPLDEALCCFWLLTDERSLMPKVYSVPCLTTMYIKIAHVLAFNHPDKQIDTSTKMLTLLEASVDMMKRTGIGHDNTISPPDELIVALLGCCSRTSLFQRSIEAVNFLIHILTEDLRVTLFGRVSARCNTDATLSICLRAFSEAFCNIQRTTLTGILLILKTVCERILLDVRMFDKSLGHLLSWLEALQCTVDSESDCYKLLLDICNNISARVVGAGFDPRWAKKVLTLLESNGQSSPSAASLSTVTQLSPPGNNCTRVDG
ncbi:telomerase reverse transcriptase [Babesia caballi]|uniref:Telomerase reverse transcriptase n=1 Tax=Babesia caballi TaxID=5871 RepID=A0AAV4LY29_BABCB|nr:telomerase reverse transcriptase [Babesia caballi]